MNSRHRQDGTSKQYLSNPPLQHQCWRPLVRVGVYANVIKRGVLGKVPVAELGACEDIMKNKEMVYSPCREQWTRVSSRSRTRVNCGLDLVLSGRAGLRWRISGVSGGNILMKR